MIVIVLFDRRFFHIDLLYFNNQIKSLLDACQNFINVLKEIVACKRYQFIIFTVHQ